MVGIVKVFVLCLLSVFLSMTEAIPSGKGVALVLVDVQYDFIDGSLATQGANDILPNLEHLVNDFNWTTIVATRDHHPPNHTSFASAHNQKPFHEIKIPHPMEPNKTLTQMLWPDHCVQGTHGAQIHARIQQALDKREKEGQSVHYVHKGEDPRLDCYSGFACADYIRFTSMSKLLQRTSTPIDTVVMGGIATDYCVKHTAIDASKMGFKTIVLSDCVRGVDPTTTSQAMRNMSEYHVEFRPLYTRIKE